MVSKKTKQILLYITYAVVLFALVMNFGSLTKNLTYFFDLLIPVFIGLLLAFVLNVPMRGIQKRIEWMEKKWNFEVDPKYMDLICLLITIFGILLVLFLAATLIVPPLVESVKSIKPLIEHKWPEFLDFLQSQGLNSDDLIRELDAFTSKYSNHFSDAFSTALNAVSSTFSRAFSVIIGIIISIYLLMSKTSVAQMSLKILYAYVPVKAADQIYKVAHLITETYSKFLSGQTVEACILGFLMFAAFAIFRLPYPLLVGVLTGISAFIPYVGALLSCGVALFLCLLTSPAQLIWCFLVYSITQFIENQFIYPRVVGSSVGLSPLLTLLAALIGGKFFGLLGILFFIPLTASLYTIFTEDVNDRLEKNTIENIYPPKDTKIHTALNNIRQKKEKTGTE